MKINNQQKPIREITISDAIAAGRVEEFNEAIEADFSKLVGEGEEFPSEANLDGNGITYVGDYVRRAIWAADLPSTEIEPAHVGENATEEDAEAVAAELRKMGFGVTVGPNYRTPEPFSEEAWTQALDRAFN